MVACRLELHGDMGLWRPAGQSADFEPAEYAGAQTDHYTWTSQLTGSQGFVFEIDGSSMLVLRPSPIVVDEPLKTGWAILECDNPAEVSTVFARLDADGTVLDSVSIPNGAATEAAQIYAPDVLGMAFALTNTNETAVDCSLQSSTNTQIHAQGTVSIEAKTNVVSMLWGLIDGLEAADSWTRLGITCEEPISMLALYIRDGQVSGVPLTPLRDVAVASENGEDGDDDGEGTDDGEAGELNGDGFTVRYPAGYRDDAEFVVRVGNEAAAKFRAKYGDSPTETTFHLHGHSQTIEGLNWRVQPGASLAYGGVRAMDIYVMARSSPETDRCCNGIGLKFNDPRYTTTVIVHELSTVYQHTYPGYNDYSGWYVQGLQQFEGLEATGDRQVWQLTARRAKDTIRCSTSGVLVGNLYWGGAIFHKYLATRFGEEVQVAILRARHDDLQEELAAVRPEDESACDMVDDFRAWVDEAY